jgi:hypothetical protein
VKQTRINPQMVMVGWREWVVLPELGIKAIKAKIDTGARTSALHAFRVDVFEEAGKSRVSFDIHPVQGKDKPVISCVADLLDQRMITDSGGHREMRFVIKTQVVLGQWQWPIEITLTNRDDMTFRMLLGRTALRPHLMVNPGVSFLQGRLKGCD